MKLKSVHLANAVLVGASNVTYAKEPEFEITLVDKLFIRITSRRDPRYSCTTSIMNMIYMHEAEETPPTLPEPNGRRPQLKGA